MHVFCHMRVGNFLKGPDHTHGLVSKRNQSFLWILRMIDYCVIFLYLFCYYILYWKIVILRSIQDLRKAYPIFFLVVNIQFFFLVVTGMFNSILAHNKLSLLATYHAINQYHILCISDTYLGSSVSVDENILSLQGYNLLRSYHLDDVKREGICMYFEENQSTRRILIYLIFLSVWCVKFSYKGIKAVLLWVTDPQVIHQLSEITFYQDLSNCVMILRLLNHPS